MYIIVLHSSFLVQSAGPEGAPGGEPPHLRLLPHQDPHPATVPLRSDAPPLHRLQHGHQVCAGSGHQNPTGQSSCSFKRDMFLCSMIHNFIGLRMGKMFVIHTVSSKSNREFCIDLLKYKAL